MKNKKWFILLSIALFFIATSSTPPPTKAFLPIPQVIPVVDPIQIPKSPKLLSPARTELNGTWVQTLRSVGNALIGDRIFATDYATGDIYQYAETPNNWIKIGTPARMLAYQHNKDRLYALSPSGDSIWQYNEQPLNWIQIGTASSAIYAGGAGLFAIDPTTGDIWHYDGEPFKWTRIGGPGKFFIAHQTKNMVLGVSPDGREIWAWHSDDEGQWDLAATAPAQCTITAIFAYEPYEGSIAIICNGTDLYKMNTLFAPDNPWFDLGSYLEIKSIAYGYTYEGIFGLDIYNNVLFKRHYGSDTGWDYIGENFEAIFGDDSRGPVCAREWGTHDLWCYYDD